MDGEDCFLSSQSHHVGDALVSDGDPDFGLLRRSVFIGHTDDLRVAGGLNVTNWASDGHADVGSVGAVGKEVQQGFTNNNLLDLLQIIVKLIYKYKCFFNFFVTLL